MKLTQRFTLPATLVAVLIGFGALASCRSGSKSAATPPSEGARLYVENCAACHGANGSGNGPAARGVGVRPRDFRQEPFRYVSSMNGAPTKDDVIRTIRDGRPLGEMPSHPRLGTKQVDLLADYVLELHRRGWIETLTRELADDDEMDSATIAAVARRKITARDVILVPPPPPGFRFDTERAHELYTAQCASCHGPTGRGDGLDLPKDSRGKPIEVRDLTIGDYRGGMTPVELFKRIRCGVPGTPMPAQVQMDDEQVWQLTYYSLFLAGKHTAVR